MFFWGIALGFIVGANFGVMVFALLKISRR